MSKSIKIPEQHYCGFQLRKDSIPLGFLVPDGTDAAALRRKATVDNWAKGNSYQKIDTMEAETYKNELLQGFGLSKEVRHGYGWGTGNVKWRIEDPRGFELEISSPNLANILACTTIIDGVIQETCIWGREGPENILIPSSSELYKNATENTQRIAKKVTRRGLQIGEYVVLQNGKEGIYLGEFYGVEKSYHELRLRNDGIKRIYIGKIDKDGKLTSAEHMSSIKLSERRAGIELTHEHAEGLINDFILTSNLTGTSYLNTLAVATQPITSFKYGILKVSPTREQVAKNNNYRHGHLFVDTVGIVCQPKDCWGNDGTSDKFKTSVLDRHQLMENGKLETRKVKSTSRSNGYGYYSSFMVDEEFEIDFTDQSLLWFRIAVDFDSPSGKHYQLTL